MLLFNSIAAFPAIFSPTTANPILQFPVEVRGKTFLYNGVAQGLRRPSYNKFASTKEYMHLFCPVPLKLDHLNHWVTVIKDKYKTICTYRVPWVYRISLERIIIPSFSNFLLSYNVAPKPATKCHHTKTYYDVFGFGSVNVICVTLLSGFISLLVKLKRLAGKDSKTLSWISKFYYRQ